MRDCAANLLAYEMNVTVVRPDMPRWLIPSVLGVVLVAIVVLLMIYRKRR